MTPLEGKYTKWYYNIISSAKTNHTKDVYTERHHIVPRSLGGSDDEDNLVDLTAKQHFICHLLLTKMFEFGSFEYYKMIHAFCMMDWCYGNSDMFRYTSKVYEKQRREFSEYMSMKQAGSGNNQFGTRWIYNENLKLCKKILKDEEIPEGWLQGRVLNWDAYFKRKAKRILQEEKLTNLRCKKCGVPINSKIFCSAKCGNAYRFKNPKTITLYRDNQTKEVKAQNVPAYKKCGWHTRQDSNLH